MGWVAALGDNRGSAGDILDLAFGVCSRHWEQLAAAHQAQGLLMVWQPPFSLPSFPLAFGEAGQISHPLCSLFWPLCCHLLLGGAGSILSRDAPSEPGHCPCSPCTSTGTSGVETSAVVAAGCGFQGFCRHNPLPLSLCRAQGATAEGGDDPTEVTNKQSQDICVQLQVAGHAAHWVSVLVVFAVCGSNTCALNWEFGPIPAWILMLTVFFSYPCEKLQLPLLTCAFVPQLPYGSANNSVWDFIHL